MNLDDRLRNAHKQRLHEEERRFVQAGSPGFSAQARSLNPVVLLVAASLVVLAGVLSYSALSSPSDPVEVRLDTASNQIDDGDRPPTDTDQPDDPDPEQVDTGPAATPTSTATPLPTPTPTPTAEPTPEPTAAALADADDDDTSPAATPTTQPESQDDNAASQPTPTPAASAEASSPTDSATPAPTATTQPPPATSSRPRQTATPTPTYGQGVATAACPSGLRAPLETATLRYTSANTGWDGLFNLTNEQDGPYYFQAWEPNYPNLVTVEVTLAQPVQAVDIRVFQDPFTEVAGAVEISLNGTTQSIALSGTDGWRAWNLGSPTIVERFSISRDGWQENIMEVMVCVQP